MAIIMDDIDDEDGPGVNSLSTDELRKEVARLQSMLGENEPEDGEEEEEEEGGGEGDCWAPCRLRQSQLFERRQAQLHKRRRLQGEIHIVRVRYSRSRSRTPLIL